MPNSTDLGDNDGAPAQGQLSEAWVALARSKRKTYTKDLVEGNILKLMQPFTEDLSAAHPPINSIERWVYIALLLRHVSATQPEAIVHAFRTIYKLASMPQITCGDTLYNIMYVIIRNSSLLAGSPLSMRVDLLELYFNFPYQHLAISLSPEGRLSPPAWWIPGALKRLLSTLFYYPAMCDELSRRKLHPFATSDAVHRRLLDNVLDPFAPSLEKMTSLYLLFIRIALGAPLPPETETLDTPLWIMFIRARNLPTTQERYNAIKNHPDFDTPVREQEGLEIYSCQTCARYATVQPHSKRSEEQKAFKFCSYCVQSMYCSSACQIRDWKEFNHKGLCSRAARRQQSDKA